MSPAKPPPLENANEEISALIATLHETGQRLEELTAGEVDAVADHDGRTFLLRGAQDRLRLGEAAKQAAILNALPAHIALLNTQGLIISVNEAWRRAAGANAIQGPGHAIGCNYLEICDRARDHDSFGARQAAAGIRSVLDGAAKSFSIEYPCQSPTAQRWFLMTVTPLAGDPPNGAVVMHLDITERKDAELQLAQTHKALLDASRQAGMAEVATNILHNVGNVLNSVNISASLVMDSVRNSRAASLAKVVALLREHEANLGSYLTRDARGQHIPAFLEQLAQEWQAQQQAMVKELESLRANIDHIKEIVAMQQGYAKVYGATEIVNVADLVEYSLRLNEGDLIKQQVQVVREFAEVPPICVEKHKLLQILVNLVRNAKHACDDLESGKKLITLRIAQVDDRVRISVSDTGVGIAPEKLTRIFVHGFTTRKDGHGFGLHSGALAATELGGSLSAHSEGPGKGATFTLELPQQPPGDRR